MTGNLRALFRQALRYVTLTVKEQLLIVRC